MIDPDDLYNQFIDVYHQRGPIQDEDCVLETANEFETLTDDHLTYLLKSRSKRSLTEDAATTSKKIEVMLREERNSWRLAKALYKDQLLNNDPIDNNARELVFNYSQTNGSDRMDDSFNSVTKSEQNGHTLAANGDVRFSEDQLIGNFYIKSSEIRRMQVVADWLEANEASDIDYKDEDEKVEFYAEGPTAWENTFHAMRAKYNIDIPDLDITINPNAGVELCAAMDPDAPIRTKKSLAHTDKEVEIRLFKHLFRFIRAGQIEEGQELAQRVGYHWLSSILEGFLPYSDPNLDQENLGMTAIHQPSEIEPPSGNKKRDVWKLTCFKAAKIQGLNSNEKAILGALGGNLRCVLPACHDWADQLWARLKCSIDVKIELALRDYTLMRHQHKPSVEFPQEFYDNYQDLYTIFKTLRDQKVVSPHKEATIHQTIQKHLILNDIDGLLNQVADWCTSLDYDCSEGAVSPHFLRFFAHMILFLRETSLVAEDDMRGTKIIESYIGLLTQQKSIESVAHYSSYLPKDNQTLSFAKLLSTIIDRDERRQCLMVAKESKLDVDEITRTVVVLIRDEPTPSKYKSDNVNETKTTPFDRRKIDALDYLLLLDDKNYMAILHHGNILMRQFALQKKLDAVKETYMKLPVSLSKSVENQWQVHTNSDITPDLRNNIRELEAFKALLDAQEELTLWSEWHHKKPEEPRRPANLSKFHDNVNYQQKLKLYQKDLDVWKDLREVRTNSLVDRINEIFQFPGGWMQDLPESRAHESQEDKMNLRKHYVPYLLTICFNVLQLTKRYEDCLGLSLMLARDDLKLYEELSKVQLREFLDKISDVTKLIVKKTITDGEQA